MMKNQVDKTNPNHQFHKRKPRHNKRKYAGNINEDKEKQVKKLTKPIEEDGDPYPGPAPINKEELKKYSKTNKKENSKGIAGKFHAKKFITMKHKHDKSDQQLTRAELLLTEQSGFIEDDDGKKISQELIRKSVDIGSATKGFELNLQFGPYSLDYTRNGRFLALCGRRGHIAAFDWMTKRLLFETNVMEQANCIKFLHQETMVAVGQKNYTYIYDNQGIELHCLKSLDQSLCLEFLPYHFLLVASSRTGFLHYLDASIGQIVASYPCKLGSLGVMCQNPQNAVIVTGHSNGTACMWLPTEREAVVKMFCHPTTLKSIAVDHTGRYLATSGLERKLKLWDIRSTYEPVTEIRLPEIASNLTFSQRNLLACSLNNSVEILKDVTLNTSPKIESYLEHRLKSPVNFLRFAPYEDALGCGHECGFASLLVPGAGEANYDALEENPMQTKKHRREKEVKRLLDKIPHTLIALDSNVSNIHRDSILEVWERKKNALLGVKSKVTVNFNKNKQKGKSSSGKVVKRKSNLLFQRKLFQTSALLSEENVNYKKKADYVKAPTNSILDALSAKK